MRILEHEHSQQAVRRSFVRTCALEADAVAAVLAAIEAGQAQLVTSEYLEFEIAQIPDPERVLRVPNDAWLPARSAAGA